MCAPYVFFHPDHKVTSQLNETPINWCQIPNITRYLMSRCACLFPRRQGEKIRIYCFIVKQGSQLTIRLTSLNLLRVSFPVPISVERKASNLLASELAIRSTRRRAIVSTCLITGHTHASLGTNCKSGTLVQIAHPEQPLIDGRFTKQADRGEANYKLRDHYNHPVVTQTK